MSQTGHKVLVVVAWAEDQIAVHRQYPQSVQQCHLLSYCFVGSTELVKHRPIQTVVDGVEGKTLGSSLRLKWEKNGEDREVKQVSFKSSVWLSHTVLHRTQILWKYFSRDLLKHLGLNWLKRL